MDFSKLSNEELLKLYDEVSQKAEDAAELDPNASWDEVVEIEEELEKRGIIIG